MSLPGDRFDDLVRIMRTLRAPGGCPWDREQTLESLRPFLLEETYEALEAIDRGDRADLREELGDLLLEIVFLAQICDEDGDFTVVDAIDAIVTKLVRRHPHVFGDEAKTLTSGEVLGQWEAIKQTERRADGAVKTTLGGVPKALPALLRAYEYGTRAAAVGFDWQRAVDVLDKIEEEVREVRGAVEARAASAAPGAAPDPAVEEELGDLFFALANLSRKLGVEPESALRRANDKFLDRFTAMERNFAARGEPMREAGLNRLEEEWQRVKQE